MAKILLVDDEAEQLEPLVASLKDEGFEVLSAESGVEALSIIKDVDDIDCILTDYSMPQMRGDELAMMIQHQSLRLPIIIMTTDLNISYDKLYRSGIYGVMTKPVDADNFIDFLKHNDIRLESPSLRQRKFLRKQNDTSGLTIKVTNGKDTTAGTISNLSPQGIGVKFDSVSIPLNTVEFVLEKDGEEVHGYMHCRWKSSDPNNINAGFEFDSITKKDLSRNDAFLQWIAFKP